MFRGNYFCAATDLAVVYRAKSDLGGGRFVYTLDMGLRFYRRIQFFRGVTMNVSKFGVFASSGEGGAHGARESAPTDGFGAVGS